MKTFKTFAILILIALVVSSCSPSKKKEISEIQKMENELFSKKGAIASKQKAMDLVQAYILFADQFADDSMAVEYLFKAADISMNLNEANKAINLYNRIIDNYPDFRKVPECLFLKGYVYENYLGDLKTAKQIYMEFLEKYPENDFADDAQISIENLGKSPEELIKEFEKNIKDQDSV